ncbi:hypothetical protein [Oricola cellulosilytica]|uniref:pyroglutamyl-peptidase I family protein n=1 Tax=Oricola cellulosilytica TaxID=1429082 RepID=UPI00130506BB|nr:hypothetical protein [Oricola cellulosilytica]
MADKTRLLVTGFTPFPGAPVNPSEHLMHRFQARPPIFRGPVECRFAVLPVSWTEAVPALETVAAGFDPQIAVHFGLDAAAKGFRLERSAHNSVGADRLDAGQMRPSASAIIPNGGSISSTLPLEDIAAVLEEEGLPVEWSGDAGDYLCNYVFYHSAAGACRGLNAAMSGFVHVGPVALAGEKADAGKLAFEDLVRGAELLLRRCVNLFGHRR